MSASLRARDSFFDSRDVMAHRMHNGVFSALDAVIDFYDHGGGVGMGLTLPNQTLPADSLRLSQSEKRSLVAFLRALTDTSFSRSIAR